MTDIRFYHLDRQSLEQVLPSLLSRALDQGHRIVVKTSDEKQAERLNETLWVYDPNSFLPHGTAKDGFADKQPVWITVSDENPNNADLLVLTQGTQSPAIADFKLCCEMLDGNDEQAVSAARTRWKAYKDAGHSVTYWQQSAKGWEKKEA